MTQSEIPAANQELTNAEVINYPDTDIIINRDSDRVGWAYKLAELFQKDNLPPGWENIGPLDDEEDQQEDDDDESYTLGVPKYGMGIGEVDGVKFLVKLKVGTRPNRQPSRFSGKDRTYAQQMNSVLREVRLSPKIKAIVASPDMQEIVQKYGYESVSFVEPVIAVIRHNTGRKYIVYEYVSDAHEIFTPHNDNKEFGYIEDFERDIQEFFKAHGIDAKEGELQHLLADRNNALHLIDTEAYTRIPVTSQN